MALLKLLYPGMRIKRWFFLFAGGVVAAGFSLALLLNYRFIGLVEGKSRRVSPANRARYSRTAA